LLISQINNKPTST